MDHEAERLKEVAVEQGHQARLRRFADWTAVECVLCGHRVNPTSASAKVLEEPCLLPTLTGRQRDVFDRIRNQQYGEDNPVAIRSVGDGWVCVSGTIHYDKSKAPGWPHDYTNVQRYVDPEGRERDREGMTYARSLEKLPEWAKHKI